MKTARQIEFDFRNAKNQAAELEGIAERLKNLANKDLGEVEQTVPSYWDGDSARLFQGKTATMKSNLLKTAKSLRDEAGTIRAIAKRIYDAEMAALELALRREREAASGGGGGGGGGGGF